jgi:hypothetical protein
VNRPEYLQFLGEKTALMRMIAETPEEDVLDRTSLSARLRTVEELLSQSHPGKRDPARVRLTFRGRPVVGSHGILAEFGMKAVNGFTESVTAMAASLIAPLAAMGPIPNRDQHQLLITNTALGSFGFELEEHRTGQLMLGEESAVAQALVRTQSLLRGTQGTDDELADSAADADRRALDKVRAFLEVLADNEAVCTVQFGESIVSFGDVGQVRTSIERLSQENLREESEELRGELQGVLPKARAFEFKLESSQIIRGKISPTVVDPDALNRDLHRLVVIKVMVTRVGSGRPRYMLLEAPRALPPE